MLIKANVVDIAREKIAGGIVCVQQGRISSITPCDLPADAPYILPGLVDSHIHIESTLCLPENYAQMALRRGVVAAVADPHEIANVLGVEGVKYMIDNSSKVRFHFRWAASPCVPSTSFETSGAELGPADIRQLLQLPQVFGLGEMMNVPGVLSEDPGTMEKIAAAHQAGKCIDGHAPSLSGEPLRKYIAAGVTTDHECNDTAEALEKLSLGMKILIREGSAARNFDALWPILKQYPEDVMFCSDDLHLDEMALRGYIDAMVRRALAASVPLWNVLKAACKNPVEHYSIPCGLLRPGDSADFIIVDNLKDFNVLQTYIGGEKLYDSASGIQESYRLDSTPESEFPNRFCAAPISADDIAVPVSGNGSVKVIVAESGRLYTRLEEHQAFVQNGCAVSDTNRDILKLVVYNRYTTARPAVGFIKSFGLKKGFIGCTVAHDSHNIVVVGASDEEIVFAVNRLIQLKGGIVVGTAESYSTLALPIAGLMSQLDGDEVIRKIEELRNRSIEIGCTLNAPFMTLSFMALPVIPEVKLTDKGLFKYDCFDFTPLFCE